MFRPLPLGFLFALAAPLHAANFTFTVTNTATSGPGSFLQAMTDARDIPLADSAEIVFDAAFFSQPRTITVASVIPFMRRNLVINGPPLIDGRPALTLSGDSDGNGTADIKGIEFARLPASPAMAWEIRRVRFSRFTQAGDLGCAVRQPTGEAASLLIEACEFLDNATDASGAAVAFTAGTLTLNRCLFEGNQASASISGGGAAYCGINATLEVNRCVFRGNTAGSHGGAITAVNLTVENTLFEGNQSTASISSGGAVRFTGNGTFRNCTFSRNVTAQGPGGAVFALGTSTANAIGVFENCTFTHNEARSGGAISSSFSPCSLTHCTVTENIANRLNDTSGVFTGGGLTLSSGGSSFLAFTLANTIVAGNTVLGSPSNVETDLDGATGNYDSLGGNLIGVGSLFATSFDAPGDLYGSAAAPLPAEVGPLQYHGGFTPTCQPYSGSAAINGGNGAPLALDQRGQARPAGPSSDKGAVEFRVLNFNQWVALHLLPENKSAFLDDPDRDGLDNLLEYYTGSDPMRPSPSPVRASMGASNLHLDYPVADHAATGSYSLVFSRSTDLTIWQASTPAPVELGREGNAIWQRVNFSAATPSRFVRLGVVSEYVPQ